MPSTPAASRFSSALSSFSFDHSVAETMSRLAVPFGVRQGRRGQFGVKKRSDVADDHADHAAAPRAQTPCRRRRR